MRIAATLLIITVFFQTGNTQEYWDLSKCINYALENNLDIQSAGLNRDLSERGVQLAKGQYLPSLNASAYYGFNFGQAIDPFTNQFAVNSVQTGNLNLGLNWTIFNGLQRLNQLEQSRLDLQSNEYAYTNAQYIASLAVTTSYLQILFNIENLKVAEEQIAITRQQVDRTEKLVEAGSAPQGQLYDIEAQLAREDLAKVDAENAMTLSYLDLKQLLRLPGDTTIQILEPTDLDEEELKLPESLQGVIQNAYNSYPSIKSQEFSLLSAEKGITIAKGVYYPTLSLSGSLGSGYSQNQREIIGATPAGTEPIGFVENSLETVVAPTFNTTSRVQEMNVQLENNFNQTFGFALSIPIFNRFQNSFNVNQAKINYAQSENALEREKQQVRQDIERAYADAVAAYKRYYSTEKSMVALQEAFDYAEKRFNVGMINAVDYNLAKNNLTRAKSDLVRAKYEYVFRRKILDFYQGIPLKL
ncbi:MAG TPA: hypothetical protein DDX92_01010 [Flavobacteriales bacterium]|jgi:outer membrane protein|nr:hypothetical protein [Flavobacteriales bacterium]